MKKNESIQSNWIIKINDGDNNNFEFKILMSFTISSFGKQYILYEPLIRSDNEEDILIVASVEWTEEGIKLISVEDEDEKRVIEKIIKEEKL